jgi:hypothetical protein
MKAERGLANSIFFPAKNTKNTKMTIDEHALMLRKAYSLARETVMWIALLLLIKGHTEQEGRISLLTGQMSELSSRVLGLSGTLTDMAETVSQYQSAAGSITWPGDGLGNLLIDGDLTVTGCILWQQELGLFQNSCMVYTNLMHDCVHGVPSYLENAGAGAGLNGNNADCICEENWIGPVCDVHTCFGRGVFELNTGLCECKVAGYTASSMCEFNNLSGDNCSLDFPIPMGESNCYGQCVDGKCICTKAGQLGLRCMQCAYPEINEANCPGRTNWGLEYIDMDDQFAVCGGGYEFGSADNVVLRGLECTVPNCADFLSKRHLCCNPLAVAQSDIECSGWKTWTFNRLDFSSRSVFNDQYRQRYLQILTDHTGLGCNYSDIMGTGFSSTADDCYLRAYNEVQTSDWPKLELGQVSLSGKVIFLNGLSLGLAPGFPAYAKLWSSSWTNINTTVFQQSDFILLYSRPYVFCLADGDITTTSQLMMSGTYIGAVARNMYWVNLLDQPGIFLPMESYCGRFVYDAENSKFQRRFELGGADASVFPGNRLNSGYWWSADQGTLLG